MDSWQPQEFKIRRVIKPIGSGGYAEVYLVEDDSGQRWALKKIREDLIKQDPRILERFEREVNNHIGLQHPHIVSVHFFHPQKGCLVTDYVEGGTLQTLLNDEFPDGMDLTTASKLLKPIEEALTYIHKSRSLAHLDITPGNILIQECNHKGELEWSPRLADFGLARVIGPSGKAEGGNSLFGLGTPPYWAPEQIDPAKGVPGEHSDIYSLGLLIGVMLTGLRPEEVLAILRGTNNTLPPTLPSEVMRVLQRATNENIDSRYPTVKGLVNAFKKAVEIFEHRTDPEEETRTAPSIRRPNSMRLDPGSINTSDRKKIGLIGAIPLQKIVAIGATILLLVLVAGLLIWNLPETHFTQLGGLDLDSYCKANRYDGVTADFSSCSSNTKMNIACDSDHHTSNLTARLNSSSHIWTCYDAQGNGLGGIDMPKYCKTQGYYGMPVAVNTSDGGWACQQKLDMTIVCIAQYNRRDVQARKDDSGLWQCYGFL